MDTTIDNCINCKNFAFYEGYDEGECKLTSMTVEPHTCGCEKFEVTDSN